jgi:formylglycine-generating enzyme required for sulfatase activity
MENYDGAGTAPKGFVCSQLPRQAGWFCLSDRNEHSLGSKSPFSKVGKMSVKRKSFIVVVMFALILSACQAKATTIPPAATPNTTVTPPYIPTQAPTHTSTPTITLTPIPGIGSTWTRPADGMAMVYVPAGEFSMGMEADAAWEICKQFASDCKREGFLDEEPVHKVYLDAYWIDRTEVTNAMYALCVSARACQPPKDTPNKIPALRYGNVEFADYPVTNVASSEAEAYCAWAGGRLPTEAEWEKAARGTDGRIYPWGNSSPSCSLLNSSPGFISCVNNTSRVGSYPAGASPYGALDMAGNVYEWVADWYGEDYYSQSPVRNPTGPAGGEMRVVRGGAWHLNDVGVRSAARQAIHPWGIAVTVGFRCARDITP